MNKTIVKLLTSRAINKIGNIFYDYGNSVWLASMGAVGQQFLAFYQMSDTVTSILFNPISGAIVDRFKRRKILLTTSLLCAIACLLAALVSNDRLMLYALVIVNIVLTISTSFSRIANKSYITELVEKGEIIRYNAQLETVLQVIGVASPIFSFLVIHFTSLRVTLLVDAISFLVSFFLIYAIKPEESHYQIQAKAGLTVGGIIEDIFEGLRYIYREKQVLFLLVLAALVNFLLAGFAYLLPFADQLYKQEGAYASLLTLGAIGSILAALVSGKMKGKMSNLLISLGLSGVGVMILGISSVLLLPTWFTYSGNLFSEFFMTMFNIHFLSQIQMRVSNELMGRVFSAVFTVAILFMPLGTWLISVMPNAIQLSSFLWIGGGVLLLALSGMVVTKLRILD
ncbi:MFS transporter [Streptococcus gallolyticus]|nr:MFS transporter [Streptococcus gallolyticus]MBY5041091.1 MFS transporter [Streptococcus gallolyticus]